ncbi:PucR family transcriptional regulator ligand-binding domain-containing protein [Kitasatospora sp. GP82]|uniref:PucR family transcriptional regulator n=1 Tax=Kitasatospora sp. GP82 TaxID=3035089 RepID=UPI002475AD67|nr:PucR family transcriptional regulator ligand-binding domain-containing protein [Kitasatospora sp. GP82]MDH6125743.1 purine catabolism regulator [Kitasatospora sp. GP82]
MSGGEAAARLTVRDVLRLELVARWDAEVVACPERLDRPVRWLHVAEAPDVAVMLAGGEMVLTTGLLLAGDERAQAEYVESMRRADAAAVVLGLGRAFRSTPEAMRRAAERCGVPLIVLHRPAPFARLTEEVHARLVHGRFAALDLSERMRSSLTALNLSGVPLQRLLDEIATYSGGPLVLVNLAHRVLATAGGRAARDDLLRDWDRISRQVAGLLGDGPVSVGPDGWVVARLEARGRQWGHLVLFGHPGEAEAGLVLAQRAAEALAVHRLLGECEGGERARDWEDQAAEVLLTELASGTARPEQLLPRARAAGLPVDRRRFVPVVFRSDDADALRESIERALADARTLTDQGGPAHRRPPAEEGPAALVARIGRDAMAVLLSIPNQREADSEVRRFAERVHERLAVRGSGAVAGAGFACPVLDEVRRSFLEAVHVADAALAAPPTGPFARLRDVRLRGLVRLLRDEPELQAFIERELGPLLGRPELLDVLRTYLRTGRNKSLAAQEHHISRPALYRRLQSIEDLLGTDLDDLEQLTSLYVALLAHDAQGA